MRIRRNKKIQVHAIKPVCVRSASERVYNILVADDLFHYDFYVEFTNAVYDTIFETLTEES